MTIPRYFYRDPLEAAYMAKHYGMLFIYFDGREKTVFEILSTSDKDPHWINPVCEYIFVPKLGDLIRLPGGWCCEMVSKKSVLNFKDVFNFWFNGGKIIHREEKAFLTPGLYHTLPRND